mmetsp:Transcript_46935/g.132364  ORF Transcript_46935/g.132364 Transcript_46935/m.132364 type:complete len:496 (+) Transcript_46935:89-1576(+)
MVGPVVFPKCGRLHYHWSQLEEDRWGDREGSPANPVPKVERTLQLEPGKHYKSWPFSSFESSIDQARFASCSSSYKTTDYNTFPKFGCLKLTEVELYFLSKYMTKETAGDWLCVYMGVGNGERFRWMRDEFFPKLSVVAYDPIDRFYPGAKDDVLENAEAWGNDGTNFVFHVRCFDFEADAAWMRERFKGKQLLLISDIRGLALVNEENDPDGPNPPRFDKGQDQDVQWKYIQCLKPVASICKFATPDPWEQYFDYAPGVVLKQIFTNYPSLETRLLIEGVPGQTRRYNAWELFEKMTVHHEQLRGLVHKSSRRPGSFACLDHCFDCEVLWETCAGYASGNNLDPYAVLDTVLKCQVYTPSSQSRPSWIAMASGAPTAPLDIESRRYDVERALECGCLTTAIAALEEPAPEGEADIDWVDIVDYVEYSQPDLASRLRLALTRPAPRSALVQVLGSLSDPFTLVRTSLNTLCDDPPEDDKVEEDKAGRTDEACSGG